LPVPITKAEFARRKGVSKQALTKAVRGPLGAALLDGGRIDASHPEAIAYHSDAAPPKAAKKPQKKPRGRPKGRKLPKAAPSDPTPPPAPKLNSAGFAEELADLTLREIADRYKSVTAYKDLLSAYNLRERARNNWLKNEVAEGRLIERKVVSQVFSALDSAFKRLMSDTAKTATRRTYAAVRANEPLETAERVTAELIGSQLKRLNDNFARALRAGGPIDADSTDIGPGVASPTV